MIREFKDSDLDRVMTLWLKTNQAAHDFIEKVYWENNFDMVKTILPEAEVYVYEEGGAIEGFIGVTEGYIAGIFVSHEFQSKGIGKQLLEYVKSKYTELKLDVYQKNQRAVRFYQREDFKVEREGIDENTGEVELSMVWSKLLL